MVSAIPPENRGLISNTTEFAIDDTALDIDGTDEVERPCTVQREAYERRVGHGATTIR